MERVRLATAISVGIAFVGILVLLAQAAGEVLADPTLSLEDGYWIGRLPWTPIGVGLTVAGATGAVLTGIATTLLRGGIGRRVVSILAFAVAAFWWLLTIVQGWGVSGAWCGQPTCARPAFDPITAAYSAPWLTFLWLLLPALIVSAISLTIRPADRSA